MLTITIEAEHTTELAEKITNLYHLTSHALKDGAANPAPASAPMAENAAPVAETKAPKRGRPAKKDTAAEAPAAAAPMAENAAPVASAPTPAAAPATAVVEAPTRAAVDEAFSKLVSTKSMDVAREVLRKFEVARISELKTEQYAAVLTEVKARLG